MTLQHHIDLLEQRLDQLLQLTEGLHAENEKLRRQLQDVMAECLRLQQKNSDASRQIETIITQLKKQYPTTQPKT